MSRVGAKVSAIPRQWTGKVYSDHLGDWVHRLGSDWERRAMKEGRSEGVKGKRKRREKRGIVLAFPPPPLPGLRMGQWG